MKAKTFLRKPNYVSYFDTDKEIPRTKKISNEKLLDQVYRCDAGVFSTNAIVVHIWRDEYDGEISELQAPELQRAIDAMGSLVARIAVTKEHFKRAIKAQRAYKTQMIKIDCNSKMEISSNSKFGRSAVELNHLDPWLIGKAQKSKPVLYRHFGQDYSFNVDPKYVFDGLMAMDEIFVLEIYANGLKMICERAEAWIAYMRAPDDSFERPVIDEQWYCDERKCHVGKARFRGKRFEARWSYNLAAWLVDGQWWTKYKELEN